MLQLDAQLVEVATRMTSEDRRPVSEADRPSGARHRPSLQRTSAIPAGLSELGTSPNDTTSVPRPQNPRSTPMDTPSGEFVRYAETGFWSLDPGLSSRIGGPPRRRLPFLSGPMPVPVVGETCIRARYCIDTMLIRSGRNERLLGRLVPNTGSFHQHMRAADRAAAVAFLRNQITERESLIRQVRHLMPNVTNGKNHTPSGCLKRGSRGRQMWRILTRAIKPQFHTEAAMPML